MLLWPYPQIAPGSKLVNGHICEVASPLTGPRGLVRLLPAILHHVKGVQVPHRGIMGFKGLIQVVVPRLGLQTTMSGCPIIQPMGGICAIISLVSNHSRQLFQV